MRPRLAPCRCDAAGFPHRPGTVPGCVLDKRGDPVPDTEPRDDPDLDLTLDYRERVRDLTTYLETMR